MLERGVTKKNLIIFHFALDKSLEIVLNMISV